MYRMLSVTLLVRGTNKRSVVGKAEYSQPGRYSLAIDMSPPVSMNLVIGMTTEYGAYYEDTVWVSSRRLIILIYILTLNEMHECYVLTYLRPCPSPIQYLAPYFLYLYMILIVFDVLSGILRHEILCLDEVFAHNPSDALVRSSDLHEKTFISINCTVSLFNYPLPASSRS